MTKYFCKTHTKYFEKRNNVRHIPSAMDLLRFPKERDKKEVRFQIWAYVNFVYKKIILNFTRLIENNYFTNGLK